MFLLILVDRAFEVTHGVVFRASGSLEEGLVNGTLG